MLLVYAPNISVRIRYVARFIFGDILNCKFTLTADKDILAAHLGPAINYSNDSSISGLRIKPSGLLESKVLKALEPRVDKWDTLTTLFPSEKRDVIPFDLFSATFWLITRYEEYFTHGKQDKHGRFMHEESLAYRLDFLKKPIVDLWVNKLSEKISSIYPGWKKPVRSFSAISSIDIDDPYAVRHKNIYQNGGAFLRLFWPSFRIREFQERINILRGHLDDPYDTYGYIDEQHTKYSVKSQFFFLLGNARSDKGLNYYNKVYQKLIVDINNEHLTGLHPSYEASQAPDLLKEELCRLEGIVSHPIHRSRQHFLRIQFPNSYSVC